jgi:phosphatidylglycerol:prolipoprotein diacylglycerol transferase
MSAPGLAIGYAIGRIGCQLSGDGDYGRATSLPWGMSYPDGEVPTTEIVHPTPVYETAAMLVVFFVLWRLRDRLNRPWQLFGLWAILAGAERFLVEFVRRNADVALGLTPAQLWSVGMMVVGAVLMVARTETARAR